MHPASPVHPVSYQSITGNLFDFSIQFFSFSSLDGQRNPRAAKFLDSPSENIDASQHGLNERKFRQEPLASPPGRSLSPHGRSLRLTLQRFIRVKSGSRGTPGRSLRLTLHDSSERSVVQGEHRRKNFETKSFRESENLLENLYLDTRGSTILSNNTPPTHEK